jgi:hypothetical protein
MDDNTHSNRLISSFLITISGGVFVAVAYYAGRQYLEGYYQSLGIPSGLLNFDTAEYVYSSFTSITIFIALVIALFAYGIFKLLIIWETGHEWSIWGVPKSKETIFSPIAKSRKSHIFSRVIFWFYTIVYLFLLIILLFIRFGIPIIFLRASLQLLYVLPCVIYGYYLTQEPNIIFMFSQFKNKLMPSSRDENSKTKWQRFFSILLLMSGIFVLWLAVPSPFTWGQSKGISDWTNVSNNTSNVLSTIEVSTNKYEEYPEITWVSVSENISKNQSSLVLILSNDNELFVRNKNTKYNSTITIIKRQDIVAIKSLNSQ